MRYLIILPCRNRFAHQHELIRTGIFLFVYSNREIMHLRRHVSKCLVLLESIHHTINRYLEQLRSGIHLLRHDDRPEYPILLIRYRSRGSNRPRGRHVPGIQINQRLPFRICHQHLFLQPRPFPFGKSLSFHQCHPCRTHFMTESQTNHFR